jgi:hypothetical protein
MEAGMDGKGPERRLGKRHVLGPVAVRWRLDGGPADPHGGREGGPEKAGLLDLSVSGCRIMARDTDDLAVGDWTTVSIRGASGPVIVRRITPSSQPGFSTYGLEFLDPMSPLTQLIHEELARRADPTRFDPSSPVPRHG